MVDSTRREKIDAGNTGIIQVDETRCRGIDRVGVVIQQSRPVETFDFHVQAIIPNTGQVSRSDIEGGAGRHRSVVAIGIEGYSSRRNHAVTHAGYSSKLIITLPKITPLQARIAIRYRDWGPLVEVIERESSRGAHGIRSAK